MGITNSNQKWIDIAMEFMDRVCETVPLERLPWKNGELNMEEMLNIFYRGLQKNE